MSEFADKFFASRSQSVDRLRAMKQDDLKAEISDNLAQVVEFNFAPAIARYYVALNADYLIEISPTKDTFNAIANHLADGGTLSQKAVQWFAERVRNPKLITSKRGRKSTRALHHSLRYWVRILTLELGYNVTDAIEIIAHCAAKSPEQIRDIWYAAPKVSG